MTQAAERTKVVSDAVLAEWYAVGWSYVGPADTGPDHSIIKWELGEPVVAPFSEAMRVAEAMEMLGDFQ